MVRARRSELRSSGETRRRRDPAAAEQLTPQELQIALQVAEGKTNKEVGAALFLSHKTVEFHLSAGWPVTLLVGVATLFAIHPPPVGPAALVCFAAAAVLIERRRARDAATLNVTR